MDEINKIITEEVERYFNEEGVDPAILVRKVKHYEDLTRDIKARIEADTNLQNVPNFTAIDAMKLEAVYGITIAGYGLSNMLSKLTSDIDELYQKFKMLLDLHDVNTDDYDDLLRRVDFTNTKLTNMTASYLDQHFKHLLHFIASTGDDAKADYVGDINSNIQHAVKSIDNIYHRILEREEGTTNGKEVKFLVSIPDYNDLNKENKELVDEWLSSHNILMIEDRIDKSTALAILNNNNYKNVN